MKHSITIKVPAAALLLTAVFAFVSLQTGAEAARQPPPKASTATAVKKCKKGEIWNKKKKACIKTDTGLIPDEELLQQAGVLADANHYEWAIEVLSAALNPNDPEILGLMGYCYRKAGRLEAGIGYYQRALAIAPDMVRVREYLGEGYASAGKIELARGQLNEIAARCGIGCPEYADLRKAIDAVSSP